MVLVSIRTKRQHVSTERTSAAVAKAPKKRMTLNSREASMSLEDVLAARNALEMYESHKDKNSPQPNPSLPHLNNAEDLSTHTPGESTHNDTTTTITATATANIDVTASPPNIQTGISLTIKENGNITTAKAAKRKRDLGIKLPETIEERPEPPSSTVSSVGHEELPLFKEQGKYVHSQFILLFNTNHSWHR